MKYMTLSVLLVFVYGCANLIATENQKQTGAAMTDMSKKIYKSMESDNPDKLVALQLVKNAETNEAVLGSPEERVDVSNLESVETVRVKAKKQVEMRKGWKGFSSTALGIGAFAATLLGAGGVGVFLKKRKEKLDGSLS